ncbi:MAG: ATP-binding cassette domain-containing protein [Bacteroidia bacterium]
MIEVKDLYKSFGENEVLRGVNAEFKPGKVNIIIGASGSGKSVLVKCLVGLLEPDKGAILYDNRDFTKMDYKKRKEIREEIGMLFQGSALFDSLTVEENVMFPLKIFSSKSKEEMLERVDTVLKRVNLENVNHLYPAEISGGMQKRVGIARSIALEIRYLFVDEPNSGLDPATASVIDNLIQELTEEMNITTIMNSHDMNSVFEAGDHILYLHKGETWWTGSPDDIKNSDNKELQEFVFASEFTRQMHLEKKLKPH